MLLLLHKRLRQLLRATLVLAIHLAVAAAALAIWWPRSQNGLPDIGGPLDVEASRALRIADDQTAFLGTDVQTEKHKQQLLAADPDRFPRLELYCKRLRDGCGLAETTCSYRLQYARADRLTRCPPTFFRKFLSARSV
jgi:hypothetical protein